MKAFHIIAVSCLVVGIILCCVALALGEFEMSFFNTIKYTEATETISGDFTHISVDTEDFDVRFVPSEDGICRIAYRQNIKTPLRLDVKDGTLSVRTENLRKWYDYITFFNFSRSQVILYLPTREYGSIQITTATGDIEIPAGFTFADASLHSTTGSITLDGVALSGKLEAGVSTGYVKLTKISAAALSAMATTGRINLQDLTVSGQMALHASTGDVKVTNATAGAMTAETSTGDIVLQDVVLTGHMAVQADTGDVRLTACDAETLEITTSTGDVRGTLRSAKIFIANTSTGRKNVPETTTGGTCKITCSTGDIDISIQ